MKKVVGFMVFTMVFLLSAALPVFSADVAKIGIVDFQKIIVTSSAGKLIQKTLQAKGDEFSQKLQNMQKEIIELEKKLKRESMVLSQEKRNEEGREYRIKVNDFKQSQKKFQRDLKILETKELQKMEKTVYEIVQKIGKKEGYLLIIEKKTAGVIYHPGSINITAIVITAFNKISSK